MNIQTLKDKKKHIPLAELYEKFDADVFKYSFSILKNYEEAKDAVQEVFANYAEHENSFKGDCSQKTWLLIISRNYCFNRLKRKGFKNNNPDTIIDNIIDPDYETRISIEDAIKKLSYDYSELIYLKDYEGYSYKEIAEITETSLENVKIRLFRARQQLRKYLKGEL